MSLVHRSFGSYKEGIGKLPFQTTGDENSTTNETKKSLFSGELRMTFCCKGSVKERKKENHLDRVSFYKEH